MSTGSWDRLELLLERARELPPDRRAAFVARETSDAPALAAELVALLEASDSAAEYISRLRQDLLGSGMEGLLRGAAAAGEGPDPWIGHTVSHYEILERLGGGGMGVVYRARDSRLNRTVALKVIAPEVRSDALARRRFIEEARAASALDHPNICTIHDVGETGDGRQFIVMAAYDGETLRSRLERPPLGRREAVDLARQIALALAAAHERGIVHRDVKPDNVFLTRDGVVKLLDFGLARMADHRMSGPGTAAGTVAYMSPEQAAGRRADARSDVWALGVILFELLAGVRPFAGEDPRAVLAAIQRGEPDLAALDADPPVSAVVRRALAKDPAQRFASGRELLQALDQCVVAPPGAARLGRSRPLRTAAMALGGLGVATAAALWIRGQAGGAAAALPSGAVAHVLWVDDNPENNGEVIRQLERRGVQVTTALSTADALQRFDPAVHHLVVSDMGRFEGVMNTYVERAGLELIRGLQSRSGEVKLMYCTSARAVASYRVEALEAGALAIVEDCGQVLRVAGLR